MQAQAQALGVQQWPLLATGGNELKLQEEELYRGAHTRGQQLALGRAGPFKRIISPPNVAKKGNRSPETCQLDRVVDFVGLKATTSSSLLTVCGSLLLSESLGL